MWNWKADPLEAVATPGNESMNMVLSNKAGAAQTTSAIENKFTDATLADILNIDFNTKSRDLVGTDMDFAQMSDIIVTVQTEIPQDKTALRLDAQNAIEADVSLLNVIDSDKT